MAWTYCITDRKTCDVPLLQHFERIILAGVDFLQIREKDLLTRDLLQLALQARAMAQGHRTKVLINDRLDIALAADLHGVHLAQASLRADAIRARFSRRDFLIGVSTHNASEAKRALQQGADYLTFGPVFATPTKERFGPPVGLSALRATATNSDRPVLALGGIDQQNFKGCLAQGAAGIAAIRLFHQPNPALRDLVLAISS